MYQAQIKIMVIILLQELHSSVRAGPKIRAGGRQPSLSPLKSGLFNRYVIVVISELFRNNHAHHQSVTQALAHDSSINYSTAPRPKGRGFKFEKNSRKGCDTFEKKKVSDTLHSRACPSGTSSGHQSGARMKGLFISNFPIQEGLFGV
jgi:hypothetical protein